MLTSRIILELPLLVKPNLFNYYALVLEKVSNYYRMLLIWERNTIYAIR